MDRILLLFFIISTMVECNAVTAFAAIGAVFISYKLLTLLKTLFDTFIASGVSVSFGNGALFGYNV